MGKYVLKRLGLSIFVVLGVSIVIFIISRLVPSDPVELALGPRASDDAKQSLREEMYLDEPIYLQYIHWLGDAVKGDFGNSLYTRRPVAKDVAQFLPATLELMLMSGFIMIIGSFLLGLLAAKHKDGPVDSLIRLLSYIGIAIPSFVMAILLLLFFGLVLKLFPVFGRLSAGIAEPTRITGLFVIDGLITGNFQAAGDAVLHLILPALALALGPMFQDARVLRASLADNMKTEYMAMAKGFGLPRRKLMNKYLLRPSSVPVITVIGLDFASLMGNAFLVETIYNWPGISRYGLQAMLRKDLNSISAVVIIIGTIFLIVNFLVDVIVAKLDPRIRIG